MNNLYLSDLLINNIEMCRDFDRKMVFKADIADGLCGIELAINEIDDNRIKELLTVARDIITTHHSYIELMAEERPLE